MVFYILRYKYIFILGTGDLCYAPNVAMRGAGLRPRSSWLPAFLQTRLRVCGRTPYQQALVGVRHLLSRLPPERLGAPPGGELGCPAKYIYILWGMALHMFVAHSVYVTPG